MKVLAVDPGYGRCGLAVLERSSGKDMLLYSTCLETSPATAFTERLRAVAFACERLIVEYRPNCVAMEKIYFSKNQKTAMRVAEVRGAILSAAGAARIEVFEYTPGEVKSAAGGSGRADKKQVATLVRALVKIAHPVRLDDEYDAIAIGITHLAHSASRRARELSGQR